MRNATDAALLVTPAFQQAAAAAMAQAITEFLDRRRGLTQAGPPERAPAPRWCRRAPAARAAEATRSTCVDGEGGLEGDARQLGLGLAAPSRPLTRARVRWPLKGGLPPAGSGTTGAVAARTAAARPSSPCGGELEDPHPGEPGRWPGPSRHSTGPGERGGARPRARRPGAPSCSSVTSPRKRSVTCQRVGPTRRRFFVRRARARGAARRRRVVVVGPGGHEEAHGRRCGLRRRRRAARGRSRSPRAARRRSARGPGGP